MYKNICINTPTRTHTHTHTHTHTETYINVDKYWRTKICWVCRIWSAGKLKWPQGDEIFNQSTFVHISWINNGGQWERGGKRAASGRWAGGEQLTCQHRLNIGIITTERLGWLERCWQLFSSLNSTCRRGAALGAYRYRPVFHGVPIDSFPHCHFFQFASFLYHLFIWIICGLFLPGFLWLIRDADDVDSADSADSAGCWMGWTLISAVTSLEWYWFLIGGYRMFVSL